LESEDLTHLKEALALLIDVLKELVQLLRQMKTLCLETHYE